MNNDENKKSSMNMNTTPFKNNGDNTNNINIRNLKSGVLNNHSIARTNTIDNLSDNELKEKSRNYVNDINRQDNSTINNNQRKNNISTDTNNNKLGQNSVANNLRNKLNTVPTNLDKAKKDAVKKGTDALKKSANPYAKAAGYAMGALQKRKDKKEQEEKEEQEEDNQNVDDNENEENSKNVKETRGQQLLKKLLPIIVTLLPMMLIVLVIVAAIMPVITAYSSFMSLFHHKKDDASSYVVSGASGTEMTKAELDYNNAIIGSNDGSVKGIVSEYQEKYNVTIDWYLLDALITYRYSIEGGNMYSADGSGDISDEELQGRLDELNKVETSEGEQEETTTNEESSSVDYSEAKKKIKAFASLLVVKENGTYITDTEKEGKVYNNILNSKTFKDYYKSSLVENTDDARKKLLDEIYDFAANARELLQLEEGSINGGVVSETSIVHLQTCEKLTSNYYRYKTINNINVYDNPSASSGTSFPDYLDMKDYLRGVLYREIGISNDYKEAMKAQTIVALSYLINDSNSGFNLKSGEMYFPSGTCRQATCSPQNGCTSVSVSGTNIHTFYIGENRYNGASYRPMNESEIALADEVINEVFGKVMVKSGITTASFSGSVDAIHASYLDKCDPGTCFSHQDAINDARNGMSYTEILKKYYSAVNFDIIDITEGLYTTVPFSNSTFNGNFVFYSQNDYGSVTFCGRSGRSIATSGCGVTSSAMVATSLTGNTQYNPTYMMNWAHRLKYCGQGISGTSAGFFKVFANELGLNYNAVGKDGTNQVVNALKSGNALVIAHMGPGHFTNGGHYIVLNGINEQGQVNVADPNSNRRSGYWDINTIANELRSNFYIISKG